MQSDAPTNQAPSVRQWCAVALVVAVLAVAALTLLPIGWSMNRFVVWLWFNGIDVWSWPAPLPRILTLERLAGVLNVILTIPAAWLAVMTWPRIRWWWVAVAITALSVSLELAQLELPLGRDASIWDVVTNATGAAIGAVLGSLTNQWLARRSATLDRPRDELGR